MQFNYTNPITKKRTQTTFTCIEQVILWDYHELKTDCDFKSTTINIVCACKHIMSLDQFDEELQKEIELGSKTYFKDAILSIAIREITLLARRQHHYETSKN